MGSFYQSFSFLSFIFAVKKLSSSKTATPTVRPHQNNFNIQPMMCVNATASIAAHKIKIQPLVVCINVAVSITAHKIEPCSSYTYVRIGTPTIIGHTNAHSSVGAGLRFSSWLVSSFPVAPYLFYMRQYVQVGTGIDSSSKKPFLQIISRTKFKIPPQGRGPARRFC